jgi:putative membrane protein
VSRFAELREAVWPALPVWRRLDMLTLVVIAYSTAVVIIVRLPGIDIPPISTPLTILNGIVLGLLLSFRNAAAYDRWWEGRKLWGQLVNDSRNICLKIRAIPGLTQEERATVGKLVAGFAVGLKNHLRGAGKLQDIPGFDGDRHHPPHVPTHLAGEVMATFQAWRRGGRITDFDLLLLDPHARAFMDVCGACERIKSTPAPKSYRSLVRHGLVLYLVTAPWFIAGQLGFLAGVVDAILAYFLLGVELTAEDVEEPFGRDADDLALGKYCDTIRTSCAEVLGVEG